jgi:diguanylate cyclase
VGLRRPPVPSRLPCRRTLLVAAVLVVAGGLLAAPPGATPWLVAVPWYWTRVLAQLLAAGVLLARARAGGEDRLGWAVLAAAVLSWTLGDLLNMTGSPSLFSALSGAQVAWIGCYALAYASLALLTRPLLTRGQAAVWLDGAVLALALAAVAATIMVDGLVGTLDRPAAEIATSLAYPGADVVLVVMAVAAWAVAGWRPPPAWRWLLAGAVTMLAGDTAYVVAWARDATYAYGQGAPFEAAWALAFMAFAVGAWQPAGDRERHAPRLWGSTALPATVTLVATALLVFDRDGKPPAIALATAALLGVAVRVMITMRELRQLALTRAEALTDSLSGLPNRRALMRAAEAACADGRGAALVLCDLDGFKEFNDTLGHEAGDELLRGVSARILEAAGDTALVARLGGDEFALLLGDADVEAALVLAGRLRVALEAPLPVAGISARVDLSAGVALCPLHAADAAGLLRHADVAMYEAKASRAGVELYDPARDDHSRDRLVLAGELREAVEARALEVHFQPKADVTTGRIVGAEALVRWPHPERGLLFPDAFLPAAEQAALMRDLALVVLDRALEACGRWTREGRDLGVAVNLSASNLLDASLPDEVGALLATHGVAPERLTLEVTEGTILANPLRSRDVLAAVGALGVAVSLDDFGTGHSSLSHVKRLPVDELKIDRSFVTGLAGDATDRAIVEAIVRLAHSLGLTVTAEGVEDDAVLALLREQGCDLAQGYLYSRPLPEEAFMAWLRSRASVPEVVALQPALQPQHGLRVQL